MSLYDADILAWSEQQAALLRRLAAGERVNNQVDWGNVIEEIESVRNEQRFAIESLLINIMQHRLQVAAWPNAAAAPHWRYEIRGWLVAVRRRLRRSPGLRPIIEAELAELYGDAVSAMYREIDGVPRPPIPAQYPWTLDELLAEPPDET